MLFIWMIFFQSANTRYLLLLMSVICAKGNEAVTNSGYTNVYLTINGPLKMLPRHFRHFHCSNFKMTFDKNFFKKSYHFLTSSKFLLSENFIFWQPLVVKRLPKIPKICKKEFCLLSICKL